MDCLKLNGKKFNGGTIVVKAKGSKTAVQLQKEDGLHTLGMVVNDEVVKDFGQMTEVMGLLDKPKSDITSEVGVASATVKFIKTAKSGRKVNAIMTNDEIAQIGTVKEVEQSLSEDWKKIIRQFNLLVELGG